MGNRLRKCDSTATLLLIHATNVGSRYYAAKANLFLGYVQNAYKNEVKAFDFFNEAENLFSDIDDFQNIAQSQLEMGEILVKNHLWQRAYDLLKNADSLYTAVSFNFDLTRLYANYAQSASHLNRNDDAIYYFQLYRKYAIIYQNWDAQIDANQAICNAYRKVGNYGSAVQYDMELVKLLSQLSKTEAYYSAMNSMGIDYFRNGNNEYAKANLQIVIDNSKDKKEKTKAFLMLYEIAAKENKPDEELIYLNNALIIDDDEDTKAQIINKITDFYISRENISKAYDLNSALLLKLQTLSLQNQLTTIYLAQEIATHQKKWHKAAAFLKLSEKLSDSIFLKFNSQQSELEKGRKYFDEFENNIKFEVSKKSSKELTDFQNIRIKNLQAEIETLKAEILDRSGLIEIHKQKLNSDNIINFQTIGIKENAKYKIELFLSNSISHLSKIIDSLSYVKNEKPINISKTMIKVDSNMDKEKKKEIFLISIIFALFVSLIYTFWHKQKSSKKS